MAINLVSETSEFMPRRSTELSAGYDIYAIEDVLIKAGEVARIQLPFKIEYNPIDYKALLFLRSSIGINHDIRLVKDFDIAPYIPLEPHSQKPYQSIILVNTGETDFLIQEGAHYAQFVLTKNRIDYHKFALEQVRDLSGHLPVSLISDENEDNTQSLILKETIVLYPNESYTIASGYKAVVDHNAFLGCFVPENERRFSLSNGVAVIDSDYQYAENEGHMFFKIENRMDERIVLKEGTKLFDMKSMPYCCMPEEVQPTEVRIGGIGSTS